MIGGVGPGEAEALITITQKRAMLSVRFWAIVDAG